MEEKSEREKHLLNAILHLLLYMGIEGTTVPESLKKILFISGTNPPTDYSRPQRMMGG